MRLFLAITLDDALRNRLAVRAIELTTVLNSPKLAWSATGAASLHVTLKFLGETATEPKALAQAVRAEVEALPQFNMIVGGLGAFPTAGRARVLWAGVTEGAPQLAELASRIDRACTSLGFVPEARPFAAHITLGRTRHNVHAASAIPVLKAEAPERFGAMLVREVTLYQSELIRGGARHTALWHVPLLSAS